MPELAAAINSLSRNERYHRALATRRLNLNLAWLVGDSLRTSYLWQLVSAVIDRPVSWREFHRGNYGHPFPIRQWAFTTITVSGRQLLMGG